MSKVLPKGGSALSVCRVTNARLCRASLQTEMEAEMANKFVKMGDITGWPIEAVVKKVGPPNSTSATVDGTLYQWIKTGILRGYHYAILFDGNGKAVGYTHQFTRGLI